MTNSRQSSYPVQIYRVRSRSTAEVYFLGNPSADTDMVTDGLLLLASPQRKEIHLIYADTDEYSLGPFDGAVQRANRENEVQKRNDLVAVGIDPAMPSANAEVCKYAFHDVVNDGYADAIETLELDEFLSEGGTIVDRRSEFVG